jgi:hypothetical protein
MILDRFELRPVLVAGCLLVAACQGSTGTGLPQAPMGPQSAYPQGMYPNQAPQSRQHIESVSVAVEPSAPALDVGRFDGFDLEIELAKPTAAPETPTPSATRAARGARKATPSPSPSPSPSPTPTASPKSHASPSPTPSGPRVDVKLTVYPDGAQKPPGDADSQDIRRVPILKALLQPSVDLSLYSLDALRFTIPAAEQQAGRGFTVAVYETRKFHKDKLIDSRTDLSVASDVVRADKATSALKLSKGHTYTVLLFGDPLPATPSPYSPPQYPGTQMNYPPGQGYPQQGQYPQQPGQPYPPGQFPPRPGFATPYPAPTPVPTEPD